MRIRGACKSDEGRELWQVLRAAAVEEGKCFEKSQVIGAASTGGPRRGHSRKPCVSEEEEARMELLEAAAAKMLGDQASNAESRRRR